MNVGSSPQVVNPNVITIPRFTAASARLKDSKQLEAGENGAGMKRDASFPTFDVQNILDVNVDFDLLADYLLDDTTSSPSGNNAEFLPGDDTKTPQATCVSSESSSSGDGDEQEHADAKAPAGSGNTPNPVTVGFMSQSEQIQHMMAAAAAHQNLANLQQMIQQQKKSSQPEKTDTGANVTFPAISSIPGSASAPTKIASTPGLLTSATGISLISALDMDANGKKRKAMEDAGGVRQKAKSQAQIDRRRERNRILARRTRLRKKYFFESLQKDVTDLQRTNTFLKDVVRTQMSSVADSILKDCQCELPSVVTDVCMNIDNMDGKDLSLMKSLQTSQQCFIITDPSLQDNPIVYASDGFIEVTGYARDEILGRNCRFLQGPETNKAKVAKMKKAIEAGEDVGVCIVNYTAEGKPFWNQLFIAALRDANDTIVNFVGVTVKVSSPGPGDPEANMPLPDVASSGEVIAPADPKDKAFVSESAQTVEQPAEANEAVDAAIFALKGVDALSSSI